MDFIKNTCEEIYKKYHENKEIIDGSEERTKSNMIKPFFKVLEYDVDDISQCIGEYDADIGEKKGEKVDYCFLIEGKPAILVECKKSSVQLTDDHRIQLARYFGAKASNTLGFNLKDIDIKLGILTNGIEYRFYTDLENPNVMDKESYKIIKINELSKYDIGFLIDITKSKFAPKEAKERAENSLIKKE